MRFLGDMQMPCRWASFFIGTLLGNLEGVRLPGLLREMNSISEYLCQPGRHPDVTQVLSLSEALTSLTHPYLGSFFLDPENNRKLSIGAIWSLVEEQGSLNLRAIWNFTGASGLL
jgi:hypothetical protein